MTVSLRLFTLLTGFGASLGLWRVYRSLPAEQALKGSLSGLWVLCGALLGARTGYVLMHMNYFNLHPELIPRTWLGGLNAFGALAGAVLFAVLAAIVLREGILEKLDLMSLILAPLGTAVWLGLWGEGVAYGKVLTADSFGGVMTPDEGGVLALRFPLQIVAAISLLVILLGIERLTIHKRTGLRFMMIGLCFSLHTALISLFRVDPAQMVAGMRIDTLISLGFTLAFILLGILLSVTREKSDKIKNTTISNEPLSMEEYMPDLTIDTDLIRKTLTDFIRTELGRAGYTKTVLGLSGGVDSALSCYLAVEALGAENVLTIRMPYRTSSPESLAHAQLVIDALGVQTLTIPITEMVEPLFNRYPEMDGRRKGNIMARERMIILFDQSAAFEGLVLGTGNKTEYLLGYTTLYGDSASALNPLGDLYKTQVWQLARAMGVPEVIIEKAPSADLWVGQTDEGELGFTYADVDKLLFLLVDQRTSPQECIENGFSESFVRAVIEQVRKTQFKRVLPPIAKLSNQMIDYDFL